VSDPDLDAEFARIIAGWDEEAPDPTPRDRASGSGGADASGSVPAAAPVSEPGPDGDPTTAPEPDVEPAAEPAAEPASGAASQAADPNAPAASGPLELPIASTTSHAWRGSTRPRGESDEPVEDGEHFVPPSEIDLPSAETDPMFWAIVGGLVGGPLLLLYVLFFDRDGSSWWVVTALTMIVVGFVLLVLRGGTERDPFDDGTRV